MPVYKTHNGIFKDNEMRNYFGSSAIPASVISAKTGSTESPTTYILPNTEFKYSAYVEGFQFYATKSGSINIKVFCYYNA